MKDLSLRQVIEQSALRAKRWHEDYEPWSPLEWSGAMCGESGEAANAAKKLKRLAQKMKNLDKRGLKSPVVEEQAAEYRKLIAKETADSILYGVCLCNEIGEDLVETLIKVFNEKSEEYAFPERIG